MRTRKEFNALLARPVTLSENEAESVRIFMATFSGGRMWKKLYQVYLHSPHWKEIRKLALDSANGTCQICHDAPATQVHHLSYDRLGAELPTDLQALCGRCHMDEHGIDALAPKKRQASSHLKVLGFVPKTMEMRREAKRVTNLDWDAIAEASDASKRPRGMPRKIWLKYHLKGPGKHFGRKDRTKQRMNKKRGFAPGYSPTSPSPRKPC